MGIFDKVAFWKKKDDFGDLDKDLGLDKDFGGDSFGTSRGSHGGGHGTNIGDDSFGASSSYGHAPSSGFEQPQVANPFGQQNVAQQQPSMDHDVIVEKNLEVLSSKIDALRATLDSVNQRLANIERIAAAGEQDTQRRRGYY